MITLRFNDNDLKFNTAKNARRFLRDKTELNVRDAISKENDIWVFNGSAPTPPKPKRDEARAHEIHNHKYEYLEINSESVRYRLVY